MKTLPCILIVALGAAAAACSSDDKTKSILPGVSTGTLIQRWTIEGSKSAVECGKYNADRMRIVIFDPDGSVHATQFAPCAAFQASLTLETKTYTGAATLLDLDARPVSTPQAIGAFTISSGRPTEQAMDIGKDAFKGMMPAQ
jgi:hypothetical protein